RYIHMASLNHATNRRVTLNLYRNLMRKCNTFDSNPKLKAHFVTPPTLRYQLPTFFLPSVSFTQNLKVLFRHYVNYTYTSQNVKEVKAGTLLVSHPSLGSSFSRSVILITHSSNDRHYGFIINQPIPTSNIIRLLQESMDSTAHIKNNSYSKNLMQHFRFSMKRPLSPFTKTSWFRGGPCSIEQHGFFAKGMEGLPQAQVLHQYANLPGAETVRDGLYLGGNFKDIGDKIKSKEIATESLMMMIGCSVWRPGQLRKEIDEGAWFQADCTNQQFFKVGKDEKYWFEALKSMGGDYRDLIK
ncbi:hypothetical protein SAMD00019534_071130, partial [Acytostelium subglobosum LB1]|uniref:hypothetical protein n=1 Tax=Acytostelium subglobosum LB1 TaxID=1410327 RepID=UPI0006450436